MSQADHVKIDENNLQKYAQQLTEEFKSGYKYIEFQEYDCHFQGDKDL